MFRSVDPTNNEPFAEHALDDPAARGRKIEAAAAEYRTWRNATFRERAVHLRSLAARLRANDETLARLMCREMGKPVREGLGEVEKAAWCFEHYADNAAHYLAPQDIESDASHSYTRYLPLGVVVAILPWNAPLWLAARSAAPALMTGNTVLVKPDPHLPACAEALAEAAAERLPDGAMQCLYVDDEGAEATIRDPRVSAVTFTGSSRGGKAVAAIAGSEAMPVVLELGGSDPAIVLRDADLDAAAETIKTSRMINAGQSCIAAKRILVERPVYQGLLDRLHGHLEALVVGDPAEQSTDIGPLARRELRDALHRQVSDSIRAGARCLLGGRLPEPDRGCFYPPTLLADVPRDASALREETFGPVAAVTPVDDVEDAIALANATPYGLAASIWTEAPRGERLARDIEAGQVAVNGLVKTDPRLPSGGIKDSGVGRELGPQGIREFVNLQQVWVGPAVAG